MTPLSGKTIVFTGTLDLQRSKAGALAATAGAKVTSAISGNTDIVVAGAQAGSKLEVAKAKGVAVWTEQQFVNACTGGGGKKAAAANTATSKVTVKTSAPKMGKWEWFDGDDGTWKAFAPKDSALIEKRFAASTCNFPLAKELSFNKEHGTQYEFNLTKKVQKNTETGTLKKLRRMVDATECYARGASMKKDSTRAKPDRDDQDDEDEDEAPSTKKTSSASTPLVLQGKTVVFTGILSMKRTIATAKAVTAGAKVTGSVSKNTDYLVCGADAGGSKADAASALGVKVISEAKFTELVDGTQSGDEEDSEEAEEESDEGDPSPELKELQQLMLEHGIPAVKLAMRPHKDHKNGTMSGPWMSKFGGLADWPKGKESDYPQLNNRNMQLAAQINCADLPAPGLLHYPKTGILQFFVSSEGFEEDYGTSVVYHSKIPSKSVQITEGLGSDECYVSGECGLGFDYVPKDPLTPDDIRAEDVLPDDLDDDLLDELQCVEDGMKMGGHCTFFNGDPRSRKDDVNLLQMNSGQCESFKLLIGDNGIMHWFIDPKELKNGNYGAAWFTEDQ